MKHNSFTIFKHLSLLLMSIGLLLVSHSGFAKGLGQKVTLDPLVVSADAANGSLTSPSITEAREQLERIPGGIGFVDPEEYLDDFAQSIGDALLFTPGVFADTSAQRENRISIRGSGLNSSFERRGITVLRDGVPITRASGSTEFQEIDPLSVRYIEVFKGANGLQFGSSSLGGAINIVTPTGINDKQNLSARIEGGSFETVRANASVAGQAGDFDYFLGATGLRSDGFRDHSNVKSAYGFSNIGYQFSENLETRFYFTALTDNFQLAGGLPFETARSNPRSTRDPIVVGPPGGPSIVLDAGPIGDNWDRNLDVYRVANRTVAKFDALTVEGGAWYSFRNLDHAITRFAGIIDQNEDEVGVYGRGYGDVDLGFATVDWTLGMQVNYGDNNARRLENNFGARGPLRSRSNQESENYITYAQADIRFIKELGFIVGGQYIRSQRENIAKVNDTSGKASFSQWSPRVGVLWDVTEDAQVFFNANRGFEPPTMSDLTAGGALDFTPLKAQQAWTVELGTRGQHSHFAWDLALYRSWVENEYVDFSLPQFGNTVSRTTNADDTIHQGIEAGLDVFIEPEFLTSKGLWMTWRNVLTVNDFFFDNDDTFGDNDLAGVPDILYVTELRLNSDQDWYTGVNLRWVPDGPYADYANTLQVNGYKLLGFTAGIKIADIATFYVSAENVLDKNYISNVSSVADLSQEQGAAIFTPGQGRAVFGGLTLTY